MQNVLEVRSQNGRVGVTDDAEAGVFAKTPIRSGEVLLPIRGSIQKHPTKYSIQVGLGRHVMPRMQGEKPPADAENRWAFLNHSCAPNAGVDVETMTFRALRDVEPGEELTFNYNTTEWSMEAPFTCHCEQPECAREVRGFKHLSPAEQERLLPLAAPHIRQLLDAAQDAAAEDRHGNGDAGYTGNGAP